MKFALAIAMTVALQSPFVGFAAAADADQTIDVEIDKAKLIHLPEETATIVQSEPIIVRITRMASGNAAVLTGTAFGKTHLVVLDAKGEVRMDAAIRVDPSSDTGVVVQRGQERTSYYDCDHRCEARLQLGDADLPTNETASQIQALDALIRGSQNHGDQGSDSQSSPDTKQKEAAKPATDPVAPTVSKPPVSSPPVSRGPVIR